MEHIGIDEGTGAGYDTLSSMQYKKVWLNQNCISGHNTLGSFCLGHLDNPACIMCA